MVRVQQTIAPLLARRVLEPVILPGLHEVDFGDWTGSLWEQVKEKFGVSAFDWLEVLDGPGIPNGESAAALVQRIAPCLHQILHDNPHRSVAIACHGGIIRVILSLLLEWPSPAWLTLTSNTAASPWWNFSRRKSTPSKSNCSTAAR